MENSPFAAGKPNADAGFIFLRIGNEYCADLAGGVQMRTAAGAGINISAVNIDDAYLLPAVLQLFGRGREAASLPLTSSVVMGEFLLTASFAASSSFLSSSSVRNLSRSIVQ